MLTAATLDEAIRLGRAALVIAKARPKEPEWRRLDRVARKFEPEFRKAFLRAVRAAGDSVKLAPIIRALEAGNITAAVDALDLDAATAILRRDVTAALRGVYDEAGQASASLLSSRASFDVISTRGLRALEAQGAELVTAVTESTRDGIRAAMVLAREQGLSAQSAAQLVRPMVGLTDRFARAVVNRAAALGEQGIAQSAIDREVRSYAERLRQHRAMTIARTEPRHAAVRGQREAWEQAIDEGLFVRTELQRRWIMVQAEHEPNDPCIELDGETAPMDAPFVHPTTGEQYDSPIDTHPNCTCQLELVFP